jgi:hypothetical protein
MWRLTKAIIISWLVGVVCGVGIVIVLQKDDKTLPASNASVQMAPHTSGAAANAPDVSTQ